MQFQQDSPLQQYNTFGIAAKAQYFSTFSSIESLKEQLEATKKLPLDNHLPLLILGGGSNLLFTQPVFNGVVLKNEMKGIELVKEDAEHVYVKAFAGEVWHELVEYCITHQYAGLENLSLIPGSVGASPMQNIGAYGVEVKDVIQEVEAWHIKDNYTQIFSNADCRFGYRESIFKKELKGQFVITSVVYRLKKNPEFKISYGAIQEELQKMGVTNLSINSISQAVINIRTQKLPDPKKVGNAGSFFKNPVVSSTRLQQLKSMFPEIVAFQVSDAEYKLAAGWLIEHCGWKGYKENGVGVHPKQALVLVNYGNGTGLEVLNLAQNIVDSVFEKFQVVLEMEVNVV